MFRGRRSDIINVLWFDGQGLCVFSKRLERGRFAWPQATSGAVSLTPAQLLLRISDADNRLTIRGSMANALCRVVRAPPCQRSLSALTCSGRGSDPAQLESIRRDRTHHAMLNRDDDREDSCRQTGRSRNLGQRRR